MPSTKHQSIVVPLPSSLTSLHSVSQLITASSTNLVEPLSPPPPQHPLSSALSPFSCHPHRAHRHTYALNKTQFVTSTDLLQGSAQAAYEYLSQSISNPQSTFSSPQQNTDRYLVSSLLHSCSHHMICLNCCTLRNSLLHCRRHRHRHRHLITTVGTAGCHNLDSIPDGKAETSARDEWFLWSEQSVTTRVRVKLSVNIV